MILSTLIFCLGLITQPAQVAPLPEIDPAQAGLDPARLERIDRAVDRAIAARVVPGAVVLIGRKGRIVHTKVAGLRAVKPMAELMTRDTSFDMASLTKPVATATAVMLLLEEGKLRLEDPVVRFLPELDNHGKGKITVEHLLRHRSGLVADNPLDDFQHGPEEAWRRVSQLELIAQPGERFVYSDVGYLILGKLVERISAQTLDRFAHDRIFGPTGMATAHFRPIVAQSSETRVSTDRIAPTEPESASGPMLRGLVHDPRSRALGGVAGHAGMFASADDLALYSQTLLDGGVSPGGKRLLAPLTVRAMLDAGSTPAGQRRGLGWDIDTSYSSPRGALFGPSGAGHTGFTGTSLWIDVETGMFVILLTSRLHPDGTKPSPTALRSEIATLAAAAIVDVPMRPSPREPAIVQPTSSAKSGRAPVLCGIDVVAAEGFRLLRGKRIGLVTNHTGRTRNGTSTIDVLFKAPEVKLVRLFSPEHGIRGAFDEKIPDGKDEATGLPIVSLYGEKQKPDTKDLEGLDVLVFDIQDIGVRFYTYSTTLGLVMEAAKAAGKSVVVLDRPNPIGGLAVSGPVRDPDQASFIAYHAIPVRHGMTIGELARLYQGERGIALPLEVVPCRGWTRDRLFDELGLEWVNPSPNMRSLTEAMLYPGIGWLEATNLATGRGTDTPFERVGAPWIDSIVLAEALTSIGIRGASFVPIHFSPRERQYKGERCGGVQILIKDWSVFDPLELGVALAVTLRKQYPREWDPSGLLKMLGNRTSYMAILEGQAVRQVMKSWQAELTEFRKIRARYLLYP